MKGTTYLSFPSSFLSAVSASSSAPPPHMAAVLCSSTASSLLGSTSLFPNSHHRSSLLLRPSLTIYARASRRSYNHPSHPDSVVVVPESRSSWREIGSFDQNQDYESDDDEEEEQEERSLDLLVRFIGNIFRKVSRRVRQSVRSVLPVAVPTKLVKFSVNGALILGFLWILKALLEVVCTFGSMVFVSILLVRAVWSLVSYIQESRFNQGYGFDNNTWNGVRPAT